MNEMIYKFKVLLRTLSNENFLNMVRVIFVILPFVNIRPDVEVGTILLRLYRSPTTRYVLIQIFLNFHGNYSTDQTQPYRK